MKITYKGVQYNSKEDLYKKHKVTRKAMEYRLNKGMTLEQALNYDGYNRREITHKGKKYKSIREIADKEGVNINTLRDRMNKGLSLDEAITQETYMDRVNIEYGDLMFNSLIDFAVKFELDYKVLRKAVKNFENIDIIDGVRLLSVVKNWCTTSKVTLWGRTYNSYIDLAKSLGLSYELFMLKLEENKVNLEEVVLEMLNSGITYKGVKYNGLTSLCNIRGIGFKMTYARIMNGWSLEDAIETPKDLSKGRKNTLKYRGIEYHSKEDLCMDYGFSTEFIRSVGRRTNRPFFYNLDIVIAFFEALACEKPSIISKPPYIIYNGLWCETEKDFCDACNVDLRKFRNAKCNMTAESPMEYMRKYTNIKINRYYFKGKEIKRSNIEVEAKKNGLSLKDFINSSEFRKEEKLKHPESTFKETGFCHNTLQEFNRYLEKHKISK